MGAVFSQMDGFTSIGELVPGLAFHAFVTALGTSMLAKAVGRRAAGAEVLAGKA
ncbi:MAG TPA: hypothetical protein VLC95_04050 [Anaerolineae bacterium]|nr:hypothetical protein [Anaerolineae bacterium]